MKSTDRRRRAALAATAGIPRPVAESVAVPAPVIPAPPAPTPAPSVTGTSRRITASTAACVGEAASTIGYSLDVNGTVTVTR